MNGYVLFDARVMTLTPLHIGTGRELMLEYDYAVHNGQTWRLNEDRVLQPHYSDDPEQIDKLAHTAPAKLLPPDEYQVSSEFFRYVIKGQPRARASGSILREQIKTVEDRPYLPGSSLKGALRTALARHGWLTMGLRPDTRKLDNRPKFAARDYEREIMGVDPNHDLLRAMQVGDSQHLSPDCLMLANIKVLTARREGSPIEVEAIRPETRFRLPVKIDTQLFSEWAGQRQGFRLGGARDWLEKLVAIMQTHAQERIRAQRAWYEKRKAIAPASFYRDLERLSLKQNQFVVQIGWGGGWDSKTLGSVLAADAEFLEWVIAHYRMARGRRQPGAPFPASRRVAMNVQRAKDGQRIEIPGLPLGWVLVDMKER
jgi:CRISPR-associated protein Csm5